jgi:hypothetical protein
MAFLRGSPLESTITNYQKRIVSYVCAENKYWRV